MGGRAALAHTLPDRRCPLSVDLETCSRAAIGQQTPGTGSAQPCESLRNSPERPHEQSDRVSSVVHLATLELACHAGGRGFESRRSRCSVLPANERVELSIAARLLHMRAANGQHCLGRREQKSLQITISLRVPFLRRRADGERVCSGNVTSGVISPHQCGRTPPVELAAAAGRFVRDSRLDARTAHRASEPGAMPSCRRAVL